jgi:hypothetical protein
MSPVGGVGINLAVQDAVAAATLLAGPLRRGVVAPSELAAVRARRLLPTVLVQSLHRLLHRVLVASIIDGRRMGPPAPVLALLRRAPQLSFLPAYLIGVGVRPEHAPDFARRPAEQPADAAPSAGAGSPPRAPVGSGTGVRRAGHRAVLASRDVRAGRESGDTQDRGDRG